MSAVQDYTVSHKNLRGKTYSIWTTLILGKILFLKTCAAYLLK
jgi:hypothetical protein